MSCAHVAQKIPYSDTRDDVSVWSIAQRAGGDVQRCVDLIRFGFMHSAARISPGGIGSSFSVFAIAVILDGPESERKISNLGATGALFHRRE
jgi:hypothetical protein